MSYHEGSNWQAKKEDEGNPMYSNMEKKYPIGIEPNNSKHQEIILKVCKAHGVKSLELTSKHIALMSDCISEYIAQQPPTDPEAPSIADYEEVLADHRRLVRELDVIINGDNAAKQASLVDLVCQIRDLWAKRPQGAVWVKEVFTEIDKARFWTKVEVTDYCWIWKANKSKYGYGMFKHHGYDDIASRVSYKIVNGYIPNDLHVLHKCDNPACVNPDHLFTGTHQDNMDDRTRKGRGKVLGRASRFHGVAFRKDSNNWRAQIFDGRRHISLGSHATEELAAKARDRAVKEMGLDLPLNFPEKPMDESAGEKDR